MRFVCISDTHFQHEDIIIPDGDVLIHAGDFSEDGDAEELEQFNAFLGRLRYRHKIIVAGNHDFLFENDPERARSLLTNGIYLQDSEVTIEGIRIYGTPWQPAFADDTGAFSLTRGREMKKKWDLIPRGIDILVTHAPPYGFCDCIPGGEHVGCKELTKAVERIGPRFHVFGHVHAGWGTDSNGVTKFINPSASGWIRLRKHSGIVFDW